MPPLRRTALALALVASATACASTTFTNVWRDPQAQQLSFAGKTIVVAVQRTDEAARRSAEDALVARIGERGAKGIASYTLGGVELRDSVAAQRKMLSVGAEGLLVMRVTDSQEKVTTTPSASIGMDPWMRRPWGWYGMGWGMAYSTPAVTTTQIVTVETRVYRIGSEDRLLWAGTSRTSDPSSLDRMILEVAARAAEEMRKEGLLATAPAK
jgi:hypothetical protein